MSADCPGASQWVTETGCIDARRYPGFWEPPGNTVILGRQIATQPSSQYTQVVATLPVPGDCTGFASMAAFLRGALRSTPTVDTARVNKYGAVVDLTINQPNGHVHVEIQATSCDTNCNGGNEVNPLLGIDYEINTDGVSERCGLLGVVPERPIRSPSSDRRTPRSAPAHARK